MRSVLLVVGVAAALAIAPAAVAADFFAVLPAGNLDTSVPTLQQTVGFTWGSDIVTSEETVAYARALAQAAPARVRLLEYGRSTEGRPLVLLVLASPARLAGFDATQAKLAQLGDARSLTSGQTEALIRELPAVVWIESCVHGDETSGTDAGLALAYLLAAGSSVEVTAILDNLFVVIDPLQNPDGRARFVEGTRAARGGRPDPEPSSAEHVQPWPGGRFSHDLFDLNRDWFALAQGETRGRVAAMLRYHPMVVADLHEMGAEMAYYFAPPAQPFHPLLTTEQAALLGLLGKGNAAAFDAQGWRYWTREVFDEFYPGYGDSWPSFTGAVGMTFEEASSRGLVTSLKEGSPLTFGDTVQHHLVAAFSTCRTVASERERFLREWYGYRAGAVADGRRGPIRAYLLGGSGAEQRGAELAEHLVLQGIETLRTTAAGAGVPTGSFVVPLDQPLGRLAKALLQAGVSMGDVFEREQERRDRKRLPDEIYDVTAWSLPLLWGTPVQPLDNVPSGAALIPVKPGELPSGNVTGDGKVAFLLRWDSLTAARALAQLHLAGVKAAVAAKPFTLQGRQFERGTVVIRRAANDANLRARLEEIARSTGAAFVGVDSGYADSGIDLGSTNVFSLKPPRVAVAWDAPTAAASAGDLRWALERALGYPVSVVRTATFAHADLSHFDVIVLPDSWERAGSYEAILGPAAAKRLAGWLDGGGTLVAVGAGAAYLTEEKVGLLASKLEKRAGGEAGAEKEKTPTPQPTPAVGARPFDYENAIRPAEEDPPLVPGAILRVDLDSESCLAAGFPSGAVNVLASSRRIFTPLKLDKGENVGVYAGADTLVQAGFVLSASREQLPRKAYLMVQQHGQGKVVAFAEDPAARGLTRAAMLLLANAVFFGAAF
ncbi:MAG: M14 family zinc carboxypeptidase [Thermoanaerobaculales bacterium]